MAFSLYKREGLVEVFEIWHNDQTCEYLLLETLLLHETRESEATQRYDGQHYALFPHPLCEIGPLGRERHGPLTTLRKEQKHLYLLWPSVSATCWKEPKIPKIFSPIPSIQTESTAPMTARVTIPTNAAIEMKPENS